MYLVTSDCSAADGTSTVLQDTAGLASINPFRYRSYYFDRDLCLCYLHRYYVAEQSCCR